jgi:putative transposase
MVNILSQEGSLHKTRRHLPHWTIEGATYFITFGTEKAGLTPEEQQLTLSHIRDGDGEFYERIAVIVMPDHVHLLLNPKKPYALDRNMKGVKGVTAHQINALRKSAGPVWEHESYDRIVRNRTELLRFFNYILLNSLKKGLCEDPWQYPYWYGNLEALSDA